MADKTIESTKDALKRLREADEKKKESRKKSKRKTGIKKFLASLLAVTSVLTFSCSGKNKNNNSKQDEIKTTVSDDDEIKPNVSEEKKEEKLKSHSLDSLGVELEFPKEDEIIENHFSNPQGDFNFDELVFDVNPNNIEEVKIYKDETAKNNAQNVGKEVVDTWNGQLEVGSDGNAYQVVPEYEIKDENGNIETGVLQEDGLPDGYKKDENDRIVEENEDSYVAPDGSRWVSKESYENYLKSQATDGESVDTEYFTSEVPDIDEDVVTEGQLNKEEETTVPEVTTPETTAPEVTEPEVTEPNVTEPDITDDVPTDIEEGVVNEDGTYTVYGQTYQSKDDFYQFLMDPSAYEFDPTDGIIKPLQQTEDIVKSDSKVLVKK